MNYKKMWSELKTMLKEFQDESAEKRMYNHADAYCSMLEEMYKLEDLRNFEEMWNELKQIFKEFLDEAAEKRMVNHADAYCTTLEDMEMLENKENLGGYKNGN